MRRPTSIENGFPPYAYIPGLNEPHHFRYKGLVELKGFDPSLSAPLKLALELYQLEYYWEAHVCLEALWIHSTRIGVAADILKCLVHVCAAFLKVKMKQLDIARSHLKRASELLMQFESEDQALSHPPYGLNIREFRFALEEAQQADLSQALPLNLLFKS